MRYRKGSDIVQTRVTNFTSKCLGDTLEASLRWPIILVGEFSYFSPYKKWNKLVAQAVVVVSSRRTQPYTALESQKKRRRRRSWLGSTTCCR